MNYTISEDRTRLTLTVAPAERFELWGMDEEIHQDDTMYEFFEHLVCNSELEWITPERTGDLTDAPMLGICEWWNGDEHEDIERWAWMSYAVRSLLEELRDKGVAVLVGGPVT